MEWIRINGDDALRKRVLYEVDWSHSFIREVSIVSPSYILPDVSMVAPDYLPSVRVFISSQSTDIPGLELLFVETEEFSVWFAGDLKPEIDISDTGVKWKFGDSANTLISKSLYCRFLGDEAWGKDLRYGWEDVFDKAGDLVLL